jgi:cyclase
MSSTIRIIPKLDIKGPNLVKGLQLEGNRVLGTAWDFAEQYYSEGADELIFQDVVASLYLRNGLKDIVSRTASNIFIPLTVAGGIRSVEDMREILRAGADKVAINTAAVENPNLISEGAKVFGSQCIVASLEVFQVQNKYQIWVDYGRQVTDKDAIEWAKEVVDRGAGEILLTSINSDGMGRGYDLKLTEKIASMVKVPVIACGGAGRKEDLLKVIQAGADAVSASSIFHYNYMKPIDKPTMMFHEKRLRMGEHIDSGNIEFLSSGYGNDRAITVTPTSLPETKSFLRQSGIPVRMTKEAA